MAEQNGVRTRWEHHSDLHNLVALDVRTQLGSDAPDSNLVVERLVQAFGQAFNSEHCQKVLRRPGIQICGHPYMPWTDDDR